MKLNIHKNIFNEAYYSMLSDFSNRYEVYYGGAGSGKSVFITQKLIYKALLSKRKILVVRKVMATQKDSCFQLFLDTLSSFQILSYCKINKSTFSIELPNGSQFLFKGLDDREKIKSITGITDIWAEEATEFIEDDILQLDLRLRAKEKNLQFYFSFNPVSKVNWVYKKWFISDDAPANTKILKTTYKDNRFLPKSYIESLESMKASNPTYYRINALGEFASLNKLIYSNWRIADFNHEEIEGSLLCGLDFGFVNDKTAFIASILDEENKKLYVFDEFCATGLTNPEIAKQIELKGFSKSVIIADSAEQKSIEEIRREGIGKIKASKKGKGSILTGIQKLQQYEIIVSPQLTNLIEELQNYSWKKDRQSNEYINEPIDDFNHCLDALRYSLQCVAAKLKTLDKNLF